MPRKCVVCAYVSTKVRFVRACSSRSRGIPEAYHLNLRTGLPVRRPRDCTPRYNLILLRTIARKLANDRTPIPYPQIGRPRSTSPRCFAEHRVDAHHTNLRIASLSIFPPRQDPVQASSLVRSSTRKRKKQSQSRSSPVPVDLGLRKSFEKQLPAGMGCCLAASPVPARPSGPFPLVRIIFTARGSQRRRRAGSKSYRPGGGIEPATSASIRDRYVTGSCRTQYAVRSGRSGRSAPPSAQARSSAEV